MLLLLAATSYPMWMLLMVVVAAAVALARDIKSILALIFISAEQHTGSGCCCITIERNRELFLNEHSRAKIR